VVGDSLRDAVQDMHHAEIREFLTKDELAEFTEHNKVLPTTLALVRTLGFK